jgi:hypothetical protein
MPSAPTHELTIMAAAAPYRPSQGMRTAADPIRIPAASRATAE